MKRFNIFFLALTLCFALSSAVQAQTTIKLGYLNADSLLRTLPEYAQVEADMQQLRDKYKAETEYNEQDFRRKYAEFLQGQKQFTQNILTKRQADLQLTLERGIAYRQQADSLLRAAQAEMLAPVRQRLNAAIHAVGLEHGLEYILDTSAGTYPFIHPQVGMDVTEMVKEKFSKK